MQTGCRLELHVVQVTMSLAIIQLHLTQWFELIDIWKVLNGSGIGNITNVVLFMNRQ